MLDDDRGVTDDLWRQLAEMGWTGVLVPERRGGSGLGLLDVTVLAEEMGRLPLPGPWLSSSVAATLVATRLGDVDVLSAAGRRRRGAPRWPSRRAGTAIPSTGSRRPPGAAAQRGTSRAPSRVVLDGHTADVAYVVARDADGVATFALESPGRRARSDAWTSPARWRGSSCGGRPSRRIGPAG